jgi:putative glycosyltransferase (TIGR04348 family)
MIALHARRSAPSVEGFHAAHPRKAIAVVLTGTDLYGDLPDDTAAARCLDLASRIVVLQEDGLRLLEPRWRRKSEVIFQSARPLVAQRKPLEVLRCVAVGHLRGEKDPRTLFDAIELLPRSLPVSVRHIGAALDAKLGAAARRLQARDERYRYLGALPHGLARAAIKSAHLLVHPSRMEGGANVIAEAIMCGTAVMASRISGNVGMLGPDYSGYFAPGDASGLALCLVRALERPESLRRLEAQCRARKALFSPENEARAVRELAARMLAQARR